MGLEDELKAQTKECVQGLSRKFQLWIASTCSSQVAVQHIAKMLPAPSVMLPPECPAMRDPLEALPEDVWALVLSKLTSRDLANSSLVCHNWSNLIKGFAVTAQDVGVSWRHLDQPAFKAWILHPSRSKGVLRLRLEGNPGSKFCDGPLRGNSWHSQDVAVPRRMGFLSWLPSLRLLTAFTSTLQLDRPTEMRLIKILPSGLEELKLVLRDQDSLPCLTFRGFTQLKVLSIKPMRYGALSVPLESLPPSLKELRCAVEGLGGDWAAGHCPNAAAAALPNLQVLDCLEVCANQSLLDCALALTTLRELRLTLSAFPHDVGDLSNLTLQGISHLTSLQVFHLTLRAGLARVRGLPSLGSLSQLKVLHLSAPSEDMLHGLFVRGETGQHGLPSSLHRLEVCVRGRLDLGMLATGLSHVEGLQEMQLGCSELSATEEAAHLVKGKEELMRVWVTCRIASPSLDRVVAPFFPPLLHRRPPPPRVGAPPPTTPPSTLNFNLICDQTIISNWQSYRLQRRANRRGICLERHSHDAGCRSVEEDGVGSAPKRTCRLCIPGGLPGGLTHRLSPRTLAAAPRDVTPATSGHSVITFSPLS